MKSKQSQENISSKVWWSLALFINVVLTILAIFTQNIPGCIATIAFGLYIAKYGDPVIFADYNRKRKEKYRLAKEKRDQYLKRKEN